MSWVVGSCDDCKQIMIVQYGDMFLTCPKCGMKGHFDYEEASENQIFEEIEDAIVDLTPRQTKNYERYNKIST